MGATSPFARVAALVAVALLTLAGVRATVMQAAEATGAAPWCSVAAPSDRGTISAPGKAHAACVFCVASVHAGLTSDAPPMPPPAAVAWLAPAPTPALGPRGPPAVDARARGPPSLPTA